VEERSVSGDDGEEGLCDTEAFLPQTGIVDETSKGKVVFVDDECRRAMNSRRKGGGDVLGGA
jgi:hypothetical protein